MTVQARLRDRQDSRQSKKANEIQSFADRKGMKKFFMHLRQYMVAKSREPSRFIVEMAYKEAILKGWDAHFDGVLNRPSAITDEAIKRLPQVEWNPLLVECPTIQPSLNSESNKAPVIWQCSRIRCNSCRDLQSRRSFSCRETDSYFTLCGEKRSPLKNSDASIIHLFKRNGMLMSVTIIGAFLYCQLLGRSLQESY